MALLLARLARGAVLNWKRRLLIAVAGLALFAAVVAVGRGETTNDFSVPDSGAQAATDLLSERFPQAAGDTASVVFYTEDGTLRSGAAQREIRSVVAELREQPKVTNVTDPTAQEGAAQVSRDGTIAYADVQYSEAATDLGKEPYERLEAVTGRLGDGPVRAAVRGPVVDEGATSEQHVGELLGIAVAIIVLTLVFRSIAAMAVTLVVSLITVGASLGLVLLGSRFLDFSSFAPTLALMLGLGAGIDYALLVIARYRENLGRGMPSDLAAAQANATAGVSVLTAGAIVIVAITGLLVTGIPFVGKLGFATGAAVAVVAVGAVTLLPIAIGAAGERLVPKDAGASTPPAVLTRWGRTLVRRRWIVIPVAVALLGGMALPFADLRLGSPDDSTRGEDATQRVAYDKLSEGFGVGFNGPLVLAASVPRGAGDAERTLTAVQRSVAGDPNVAFASPPVFNERRDAAILQVIPRTSPQDDGTSDLIERLREERIPRALGASAVDVYVGGATATNDDLAARIADRLPLFIGVVVVVAILLLMAAFRSVLVPLVSAGFNLLSVLAAYGLTVLVFQKGGGELFGVAEDIPIISFVPLFMFALLFGLSMDYNVFQQSRIHEEVGRGRSPHDAVVIGFAGTGKVIAAAGAIMVAVFGAFILSEDVTTKVIGFGLASAILIDVVLVRYLLAPAVIAALGERAWWLPRWMDRLLPQIALEGKDLDPADLDGRRAGEGDRDGGGDGTGGGAVRHEPEPART